MARATRGNRAQGVFWRALEAVGVKDAKARWERQPEFLQRAVPPVVIALLVMLVAWLAGVPPHRGLLVVLAVVYLLYLLPSRIRRFALPATVVAAAVLYPILWAKEQLGTNILFEIPIFGALPNMDTMVVMLIFAMMAVGLNIVVGYAGLLDLGYVAFYALGAYTVAWLASPHWANYDISFDLGSIGRPEGVGGIHVSIWLVLLAAAIVTAVGGILIGLPTLRLRGDYLAIVTLGFGEIIAQVARNGDKETLGINLTNGPPGINPIDPPGFGEFLGNLGLPSNYLLESGIYVNFVHLIYWTALGLLLITVFCSIRLRDSRLGRAWIAIREDEVAAAAMGIPLMRTKTWAYASGAFFGGIAGAWFGSFKQGVFPDDFYFNISILVLTMVILGGMGNVWGVIAGAAFLTYLFQEGLSNITGWFNNNVLSCDPSVQDPTKVISGGCVNAPVVQFGIFGMILVLTMLFRPQGLIPEQRRQLEFETGVRDEPLMDVRHAPEE